MTAPDSHAKNRAKRMTAAEKREAKLAANRKARLQWYMVGGLVVLAIIVAIILIAIFTDGEIPSTVNPNL